MNNKENFLTTTYAKCILAGEHAVIRGHPAIVVPLKSRSFQLSFQEYKKTKREATPAEDILIDALDKILQVALANLRRQDLEWAGEFRIKNSIPVASGLGFSSALCAAVTQWLIWKQWLSEAELLDFARGLENSFHGKSSGVDVAGALADSIIYYQMHQPIKKILFKWQPELFLSFTGNNFPTKICIERVEKMWVENKELAEKIDQQMMTSVKFIYQALTNEASEGLSKLVQGIDLASDCFTRWGLIDETMQKQINTLKQRGALAVKPTGSGGGGYLLSLWQAPPPLNLSQSFLKVLF